MVSFRQLYFGTESQLLQRNYGLISASSFFNFRHVCISICMLSTTTVSLITATK